MKEIKVFRASSIGDLINEGKKKVRGRRAGIPVPKPRDLDLGPDPAATLIKLIDEALTQFGTYQFDDKGPHEVMDMPAILRALEKLPIQTVGTALVDVLKAKGVPAAKKKSRGRYYKRFVETVLVDTQDWPEAKLKVMFATPGMPQEI